VFDNHDDIWTTNADGKDLTQLTDSAGIDFDASWSPDGTQIAYRHDEGNESEIWVMNADGTGHRRLTAGTLAGVVAGRFEVAYTRPRDVPCTPGRGIRCTGISIMDSDGSGQHRVPNTDVANTRRGPPTGIGSSSTPTLRQSSDVTSSMSTARTSPTSPSSAKGGR
jgi:hypothetical protein